jgi:multiple sugar transport system substrate-binding protein
MILKYSRALFSLLLALVMFLGCQDPSRTSFPQILTYTYDEDTRKLINILEKDKQNKKYLGFDRRYKGLMVPQSLLVRFEPFVLALSTESKIPAVLLLDAPWVQRYGVAGWLYELETARFFSREELVPSVAEAFSVELEQVTSETGKKLVAVPSYIKGNILFYRRDLLKKHGLEAPRTWDELRAACRKVIRPGSKVKYGLILHVTNFLNDFYPILWGYGGRVIDRGGRLVLGEPKNLEACTMALRDLKEMQGTIIPGPERLKLFAKSKSLRQSFYQGEALFMINWNTRTYNLRDMIEQCQDPQGGCLNNFDQVGVAPIPSQQGHQQRFSNIGSFGWGVNRFSVTQDRLWVVDQAREFIRLVTDKRFQIENAVKYDQVPSLLEALKEVKKLVKEQKVHPKVLEVYENVFAVKNVRLKPRPYSRHVNNVLEKHLVEVLLSERTPAEALQGALQDLQGPGPS